MRVAKEWGGCGGGRWKEEGGERTSWSREFIESSVSIADGRGDTARGELRSEDFVFLPQNGVACHRTSLWSVFGNAAVILSWTCRLGGRSDATGCLNSPCKVLRAEGDSLQGYAGCPG